ncbi:single-stranded-DNA-specific exonuclease RecJ [Aristophania vespae]|uniref:Single-stranded-DNA-specific exonuclease RecJ n=1 Tax=Aristophania vespae TaxID=2697033 RepID=A0A6P1NCS8_9PROT|nr:single-stranded-DNA-specific exonuclease RecJ [Aristophania vespae]QHI96126.1 single-stranded-DNA-specific exonuclease RecJ [Aristophania vespae]
MTFNNHVPNNSVLGVTSSAGNRQWVWRKSTLSDEQQRLILTITQQTGLTELTARILAGRGIGLNQLEAFLEPRLERDLPDPSCLKDMDQTSQRLADAIEKQEVIGILGDYDVDGACGTALLASTLSALGCKILTHIPDRITEGYGPNTQTLESFITQGATLLICVDCGTAAHTILDAFEGRADRIILDHHKPNGGLIPKGLVVNPNRLDCDSNLGFICATAVSFFTMIALRRELRSRGWLETHKFPNLLSLLDLTALATICDVMPLYGVNRTLVTQGLKVLNTGKRLGLQMLAHSAGVKDKSNAMACGFALGPRINAGGRIAQSDLGLKLLLSQSEEEARALAETLDGVNRKRQTIEGHALQSAIDRAQAQIDAGHAVILLCDKEWHPGIVGIVAGRLKERFNRPTLIGALNEDNIIKGSARSVTGLDIGNAIIASQQAGLLLAGGGHSMAAGFSLKESNLEAFHQFLNQTLSQALTLPPQEALQIDGILTLNGATPTLAKELSALAPFGNGNEEPILALSHVRCVKTDRIGKDGNTLRVILQGEDGFTRLKGLVFRAAEKRFTNLLEDRTKPLIHVAGQLRLEEWQGIENLTFFISDATPS